jgi:hypothetical protein
MLYAVKTIMKKYSSEKKDQKRTKKGPKRTKKGPKKDQN